jgi:hypothetical protein
MIKISTDMWYTIPGFNGYEINSEGLIRSMKFMNVAPEGYIITSYPSRGRRYVKISNDNNEVVKMFIDELIQISVNENNKYLRNTHDNYKGSRNLSPYKKHLKSKSLVIPRFNFDNTIINDKGEIIEHFINPITFIK